MESLKPIESTGGLYYADNLGHIYSYRRGVLNVLKAVNLYGDYMYVSITYPHGRRNSVRIDKLVAEVFLENKKSYPDLCHINGDLRDNRVSNLRWCEYKRRNGFVSQLSSGKVRGSNHHKAKLTEADVRDIRTRIIRERYRDVYEDYKDRIGWWTFRDICRGKGWTHVNIHVSSKKRALIVVLNKDTNTFKVYGDSLVASKDTGIPLKVVRTVFKKNFLWDRYLVGTASYEKSTRGGKRKTSNIHERVGADKLGADKNKKI